MPFDLSHVYKFPGFLLLVGVVTGTICTSKKYFTIKTMLINTRNNNNRVSRSTRETDHDSIVLRTLELQD